ncbi:MAG: hypothetical protein PHO01_08265 [Desulfotomaculaceae bacterium]|nr:hypothetical protein [Desulfotomaculaceae bacterium]
MAILQRVPMVNPNDNHVCLIEWVKSLDDYVQKGDIIAVIETSKAVFDIEAESSGYLVPLVEAGENSKIGKALAVIKDTRDEDYSELLAMVRNESEQAETVSNNQQLKEKKWTKKAEILANKYQVDLNGIVSDGLIREEDVMAIIEKRNKENFEDLVEDAYPGNLSQKMLILGGGRGAVQVIDVILRKPGFKIMGILDDDQSLVGKYILGYKILGPIEQALKLWENKLFDALVISFSNDLERRAQTYEKFTKHGIPFANIIDPGVSIHTNVTIGEGNVIMPFSRIGSCSIIGNNNFLSAYVNIEHHNSLGSHCTFGPGVLTSGRVNIGDKVKFGTGIFIEPGVHIGDESIVASGSVLTIDVPPRTLVKTIISHKMRVRDDKINKG